MRNNWLLSNIEEGHKLLGLMLERAPLGYCGNTDMHMYRKLSRPLELSFDTLKLNDRYKYHEE